MVTILFADLVGSTALAERLDPEETKLIVGEAVGRVISIVESFGGHVKDIAGDGVLALFGAPTAHEDDPERAARAGLAITRSIADYAREVSSAWAVEGLAVRVGVNTGEVVVGEVGGGSRTEYGAVGDAVNVAARLQGSAPPGAVILSEATHGLVRGRFDFEPVMELELKGKAEPVRAYVIAGLNTAADPVAVVGSGPLVGRNPELDLLQKAAAAIAAGRGGVLAIVGEPGIGKSRMAAELRQLIGSGASVSWLEGRCVSYGEALPYWPYRDLLRNWIQLGAQDPEVKVRITLMRWLERVFPGEVGSVFPYLAGILGLKLEGDAAVQLALTSPEAVQFRSFEVCHDLVARLSAAGPLVLFIDDLHWADPTSIALTERLIGLVETSPVLLVFCMRPETDHPAWALKERVAREYRHLFSELSLLPLGPAAEAELLTTLAAGAPLTPDTTEQILEFSAGNAFYLEEIVRSVQEARETTGASGAGGKAVSLPGTIETVVLARIDRLQPEWREVLTAASVLGRSFNLDLLSAVADRDQGSVRDSLHHLLRLDLLQDDRRGSEAAYRFKHALIQDTAYRTLVGNRRSDLHSRAARWFETLYEGRPDRVYGLLAYHWRAAGDLEKASYYLRLAGDQALSDWALDEAVEQYRALLPLLEERNDEKQAAEILFQIGSTLHMAMRYHEANEVWERAFELWRYSDPPSDGPTATLRIASVQVPWMTDPSGGYYATNQTLFQQLWDRLLEARPAPYVVPGLASSWHVSDDGLRYRFRLRDGVKWNNGTPITSADVVYALQRIVDPEHLSMDATMLFHVQNAEARSRGEVPAEALGVRALDERTVEVVLNHRVPYFLFYFVYPEFSAVRPSLDASGPFKLASMTEDRVVVERDPSYARRRGGNVHRVEWVLLRDPDQIAAAARANEIDAVWGNAMPSGSFADLDLTLAPAPTTLSMFVTFVGEGEFEPDLHLRRALALATNREPLAPILGPARRIADGGLVPPGLPGHTPDIAPRFDAKAAREELARSGHRGPFRIMVATEQYHPYVDSLLRSWEDHLGIEVKLEIRPMAGNLEWRHQAHAAIWHWVAHAPAPEYFLRNLLHSQSLNRLGAWSLPALDDLLDRAVNASDGRAQLDLYHQADRLVVNEECLVIPIAYGGVRWLLKPWVHGIWQWGAPWQSWDEVRIDETSPRHG